MTPSPPAPGELWEITGPAGYGVYLGQGFWNVLIRCDGEYSLTDTRSPDPVRPGPIQPEGMAWAEQFDALAAASGLGICWADEIRSYQASGFARIFPDSDPGSVILPAPV